MKKVFVCLSLLLCLFSTGFAVNWKYLYTFPSGVRLYIDTQSAMIDRQQAIVWTKSIHPNGYKDYSKLWLKRNTEEWAIQEHHAFNAEGEEIYFGNYSKLHWNKIYIDSDTESDILYQYIWGK